ncbi:MAG: hypothetical protein KAS04_07110, partial [Candidatus Aenigmarchaeota archaeon]|nr:hypothetical protein [Candidatus Aenigmarchaeota archaeon]
TELPTAPELAQGLMTTIDVLTNLVEDKPMKLQDQITIQESVKQPIGELQQPPDINRSILQQQLLKKPEFEPTIAERLPFLDRDVSTKLPLYRPPERSFTKEGTVETKGQPKAKDVSFHQRAMNQINSTLLKMNLHSSGVGDLSRELLTPIVAGINRMGEGDLVTPEGLGNIALGIAGTAFGTFMMPFSIARATGTQLGGETAGKVAELTSLGLAGGIPLIAGYFASQGATGLANNLMEGKNLTEKQRETIEEVVGLFAFIGGAKVVGKGIRTVKTYTGTSPELYKKVLDYTKSIDKQVRESLRPDKGRDIGEFKEITTPKGKRTQDKETGKFITKPKEKPQKEISDAEKIGKEIKKPSEKERLVEKEAERIRLRDVEKDRLEAEKVKKKERTFSEENYKKDTRIIRNKPITSFAEPTVLKAYTRAGAYHLENIIRAGGKKAARFKEWTKEMVKDFGQKIKPHLLKIWAGIKKEFGKKIAQVIEHPVFPIKQTKIMEGKFLDVAPEKLRFKLDKPIKQEELHKGYDTPRKREVAIENDNIRRLRTTDYYQRVLEKKPTEEKIKEAVRENPTDVKYNEWMAMHKVGKDTNP